MAKSIVGALLFALLVSHASSFQMDGLKRAHPAKFRVGLGTALRRASGNHNDIRENLLAKRSGSARPGFLQLGEAPPKLLEARQHGKVALECSASGNPAPQITWLKNGQPLHPDHAILDFTEEAYAGFPADSMSETKSRISLECITEADAGLYECVAHNDYDRASVATEVNVVSFSESGGACSPRHSHAVDISPPRIVSWMGTYMQPIGSDAHLLCRADGHHTTGWIGPDMQVISEGDPKYRVLSNGDLVINKLDFSSMGMFKCVVANENGEDMQETFVYPHAVK